MNIVISNHARERFSERWTRSGSVEETAELAWKNGKRLFPSLEKTIFLLGLNSDGYWISTHKVYMGFVFVFRPADKGYCLTTIMPLDYLRRSRRKLSYRLKPKQQPKKVKKIGYWDFTKPNPKRIKIKL